MQQAQSRAGAINQTAQQAAEVRLEELQELSVGELRNTINPLACSQAQLKASGIGCY